MIKAIVLDLDNTLVDFMAMKRQAIDAAIRAMIDAGLGMSFEEASNKIDHIYKEQGIEFQKVFDTLLYSESKDLNHKVLAAGIISYRRAREAALVPYPHVFLTLVQLIKRGIKLAVVSDAPSREAWLRLTYLNLHHLFDVVLTHQDTGEYKPSPVPFKTALERLGVDASEALMVGDWAERDVAGAAKVGMKTVFARYGDVFDTEHSGADYEIDDIQELLEIVDNYNKK